MPSSLSAVRPGGEEMRIAVCPLPRCLRETPTRSQRGKRTPTASPHPHAAQRGSRTTLAADSSRLHKGGDVEEDQERGRGLAGTGARSAVSAACPPPATPPDRRRWRSRTVTPGLYVVPSFLLAVLRNALARQAFKKLNQGNIFYKVRGTGAGTNSPGNFSTVPGTEIRFRKVDCLTREQPTGKFQRALMNRQ